MVSVSVSVLTISQFTATISLKLNVFIFLLNMNSISTNVSLLEEPDGKLAERSTVGITLSYFIVYTFESTPDISRLFL